MLNKYKINIFLILFLYTLISVFVTYPSIFTLNTKLIGDGGDNIEYLSYQRLARYNIDLHKYPFAYTTLYRYPFGYSFGSGSDARLFVLLGALLPKQIGYVLIFNLLFFAILIANSFSAYAFFSVLNINQHLRLLGGIIYGFSYYVLARGAGHINIMQVYGFPLFFYSLISIYKNINRKTSIIVLFLSILFVALSSIQYSIILTCVMIILLLFIVIFSPYILINFFTNLLNNIKNNYIIWILFLVVFIWIFLYLFQDYLWFLQTQPMINNFSNNQIHIFSYLFPNSKPQTLVYLLFNHFNLTSSNGIDNAEYLGLVEMVLFVFFTFKFFKQKFFWSLTIIFVILVIYVIDINSKITIFVLLKRILPFSLIGEAERNFPILYLVFTSLILFALSKLKLSKFTYVIILLALIFERITFNYDVSDFETQKPYTNFVKTKIKSLGILDLPLVWDNFVTFRGVEYNLLPFYYDKPIVEGYFNWTGETKNNRLLLNNPLLKQFYCDSNSDYELLPFTDLIRLLNQNYITTIVLHKKYLFYDQCTQMRQTLFNYLYETGEFNDNNTYKDLFNINNQYIKTVYDDSDAMIIGLQ